MKRTHARTHTPPFLEKSMMFQQVVFKQLTPTKNLRKAMRNHHHYSDESWKPAFFPRIPHYHHNGRTGAKSGVKICLPLYCTALFCSRAMAHGSNMSFVCQCQQLLIRVAACSRCEHSISFRAQKQICNTRYGLERS